MVDKLKPGTKAWNARQDRWRHNSFIGHAKMMEQQCRSIMESQTATEKAKICADEIYQWALVLGKELKTRKPGT